MLPPRGTDVVLIGNNALAPSPLTAGLAPLLRARGALGVGVYDGLSTLLAARHGFTFLWVSSFGVSASLGLPDAGLVDAQERARIVRLMRTHTELPLVVDMDAAADDPVRVYCDVRDLVDAGATAVCIEDVVQRKRSSLYDRHPRRLATIDAHCLRLRAASAAFEASGAQRGVISRTEALVSGDGLDEALRRCVAALEAGADAVFIQSLDASGNEALRFCRAWGSRSAVFLAPTRYERVPRETLFEAGATHVIFANQAVRAAHKAIDDVLAAMHDAADCDVSGAISPVRAVAHEVGADALLELEGRLTNGNGRRRRTEMHDVKLFLEQSDRYLNDARDQWSFAQDVDMETVNHIARVWVQQGTASEHMDEFQRLASLQHEDGGWGDRRDDPRSRGRTSAFSCQMLLRVRRSLDDAAINACVERGLDFLVTRQLADGRWEDDRWHYLDATSVSVGTMIFAVREPGVRPDRLAARRDALDRGMAFVLAQRAGDGLWYHKPSASPVEITAHLLQKCVLHGVDEEILVQAARGLLGLQSEEGHWDAKNTDSTCDVLRCLMLVAEHESGAQLREEIDAACDRAMAWLLKVADNGGVGVRPGRPASVLYTCDVIDSALKYAAHHRDARSLVGFYR